MRDLSAGSEYIQMQTYAVKPDLNPEKTLPLCLRLQPPGEFLFFTLFGELASRCLHVTIHYGYDVVVCYYASLRFFN